MIIIGVYQITRTILCDIANSHDTRGPFQNKEVILPIKIHNGGKQHWDSLMFPVIC